MLYDGIYERLREILTAHDRRSPPAALGGIPKDLAAKLWHMMQTGDMREAEEVGRALAPHLGLGEGNPLLKAPDLSREQVFFLLGHGWWDEPFSIRLNDSLTAAQLCDARFFTNARVLLEALSDSGGAPTTAKGNLTRAFVAGLLDRLAWAPGYLESIRGVNRVINETDVWPLHQVRIVCKEGGLFRRYKKRFVLTRKGEGLLPVACAGKLYRCLFDTFFRKYNLAYMGYLPECPDVQETFPYTLYEISQLPKHKKIRMARLPSQLFLPHVHKQLERSIEVLDVPHVMLCHRVLRPLEEFGLIKIVRDRQDVYFGRERGIRRLPLFDDFIDIHV